MLITLYCYKPVNISKAVLVTTALIELSTYNNSTLKILGSIGEVEIFHMLPENCIKLNITHTYVVTGENPVNG